VAPRAGGERAETAESRRRDEEFGAYSSVDLMKITRWSARECSRDSGVA
jgi:hypothetical protein